MKKILFTIVAALMAAPTFAQYSSSGFVLDKESLYYGIRIGMTAACLSGSAETDGGREYKTDLGTKTGLTLAGVLGLRLSSYTPVFLESGLYYTERGGKDGDYKVSYTNLEVPLLLKYGIKAGKNVAILPYVGPYFAYAVSGKTKCDDNGFEPEVGTFDEKKAKTGGLNRFNMGVKLGCGFEYDMLYLEAGYQLGISNIGKNGPDGNLDLSARSNAVFVNLGVNF